MSTEENLAIAESIEKCMKSENTFNFNRLLQNPAIRALYSKEEMGEILQFSGIDFYAQRDFYEIIQNAYSNKVTPPKGKQTYLKFTPSEFDPNGGFYVENRETYPGWIINGKLYIYHRVYANMKRK